MFAFCPVVLSHIAGILLLPFSSDALFHTIIKEVD